MRTARSIVTRCALAGWLALTLVLAGTASGVVAADFAHGDALVVVRDTEWHYDPGVSANFKIPAGDDVTVLDGPKDGEYFVAWGDDQGWVDAADLTSEGSDQAAGDQSSSSSSQSQTQSNGTPSSGDQGTALTEQELTGNSVKVANSSNGVNLRAKPSHDADVVDKLPEDTVVSLRIDQTDTVLDPDGTTRWWPVSANGHDGWIAGFYLAPASSSSSSDTTICDCDKNETASGAGLTEDQLTGNSVKVANSQNGVNLRSKPSTDCEVLDKLPEGTVVQLRIDQTDTVTDGNGVRWWPVTANGKDGWIAGQFLAPTSSSASASAATSQAKFTSGDYAMTKTISGKGVVIRSDAAPDASRVGSIAEGDVVQVMGGPNYDETGNAWYKVTYNGVTGWVDGDLLVPAPQPSLPASEQPSPAPSAQPSQPSREPANFAVGDYAAAKTQMGIGVNIHQNPSMTSIVLGSVAENGIVQMEDGPIYDSQGNVWYRVTNNGVTGYVDGTLFVAAQAPAAPAPAAPAPQEPAAPVSQFIYPLSNYTLTQGYGCTGFSLEPYDAALGCNFHNAVDLADPQGTPIMAAAGGTVVTAGWCDCGLGYMVEIDHGNGFHTVYGHMMQQPSVAVGQQVNQGDVIGYVGSTGASTGPHTHFEIVLNGNTVNPLDYLP